MTQQNAIPTFTRYGETDHYPDVVHSESFSARAPIHDWRIIPHRHASMSQVFLCKDGWIDAKVDGKAWHVTTGYYLFVPAHSVHEFRFQPDSVGQVISIPNTVTASLGPATAALQKALSTGFFGAIDHDLAPLADALDRAARGRQAFRTQRLVSLAHSVLAVLAESRTVETDPNQNRPQLRLQALDNLIATHIGEGFGASDYARALAISTGHLSRLCRAASGLGATAFIEQRIMQEACRMLAFTLLPVSDIGYRLGYADPSYFSKRFHKALGCTPSAYRGQFVT